MGLETTRARASRAPSIHFRTRLYFAIDVIVVGSIFAILSHVTWRSFQVWRLPEIALPSAVLAIAFPIAKVTVLRNETDRVRRLAKLQFGVIVAYSVLAAYLVLSRAYYSRFFFLSTFLALMVWQVVDTMMLSAELRPRLVAVPSSLADRLRSLPESNVTVLREPSLEVPADGVVVDLHQPLPPEWQMFIAECAASGIHVYHAAAVYESYAGRVPLDRLNEGVIVDVLSGPKGYRYVKRVLDIGLVLVSLPVVVPLSFLLALLIKLDSPGPALYWQERVGERGKPFKMAKFRSMYIDAEDDRPKFAATDDPRITRIGRIMRRFRLDEIPQLWNVLKGEMSLIGPRPEQVTFARQFERELPFYSWRHLVKPGITGWAQVQHGYAAGVEDTRRKLEYDLYYVKHFSFWLDVSILMRTIGTVLTGNGAR